MLSNLETSCQNSCNYDYLKVWGGGAYESGSNELKDLLEKVMVEVIKKKKSWQSS